MGDTVTLRSFRRHVFVVVPRCVDARSINPVSFSPATVAVFMIHSMRWRLAAVGFVVVAGSVGVGVAASTGERAAWPNACVLPGPVGCTGTGDPSCSAYGAVCDPQSFQCVCAGLDLGTDLGSTDLAGADLAPPAPSDGGASAGTPPVGGGMTSPARNGCSFVPGSL
jgi:hypothetical protein